MGKRSNKKRRKLDFYPTPFKAVPPLITHLDGVRSFAEPCCGADLANPSRQGQRTDLERAQQANGNFVDNTKNDINEVERPTGTSRAAGLRRLRKDRPDIHVRVLNGEISAHAGMVEAGFRQQHNRPRRKLPMDDENDALTRLVQAYKDVQQLDPDCSPAKIAQAYAERRAAIANLVQWDDADNINNAAHRLMMACCAIQDLHEQGSCHMAGDDEFEDVYAEREKAISLLITAAKQPSVTWPPSDDIFGDD
jgi:hypothetical protein